MRRWPHDLENAEDVSVETLIVAQEALQAPELPGVSRG
jgi:hypothetical protein